MSLNYLPNLLCESLRSFLLEVWSKYAMFTGGGHGYHNSQIGFFVPVVEDDPNTGKDVVGRGGFPNEKGILECDAAIMDGNGCRFGAVAALQG